MINQGEEYRVCSRGLWDTTIPGITFDDNGVSNYCQFQEFMMNTYPQGEEGLRDWKNIVNQMKEKGEGRPYDCIVGVSGGVDSSYLLVFVGDLANSIFCCIFCRSCFCKFSYSILDCTWR